MKKNEILTAHLKTYVQVLDDRSRKLCEWNPSEAQVERDLKMAKASAVHEIINELRDRFGIERVK